jgi:hypothetical protein
MIKAKTEVDDSLSYKEWAWKEKTRQLLEKEEKILNGVPKKEIYSYKKTQAYQDRLKQEAESEYALYNSSVNAYKKKKNRPIVNTAKKEFDFLKYYRIVIYWASRQYEMTKADLELMFFLYNEKPFTKSQFEDYCYIMVWDKSRFDKYIEKGWIIEYAFRGELGRSNSVPIYKLSFMSKRRVKAIYDRLTLRNLISEEGKNTKIFQKKVGYNDKRYAKAIREMNVKAREMRNGESDYYLEEDMKYVK